MIPYPKNAPNNKSDCTEPTFNPRIKFVCRNSLYNDIVCTALESTNKETVCGVSMLIFSRGLIDGKVMENRTNINNRHFFTLLFITSINKYIELHK